MSPANESVMLFVPSNNVSEVLKTTSSVPDVEAQDNKNRDAADDSIILRKQKLEAEFIT